MANKIGKLIKEARTQADLTQEQLARKVKNVSAADISKAERGELKLTQDALKAIAKATGVTQKSLLDAAASSSYKKASQTTSSAKASSAKTSSSSSGSTMKVTAAEKKLLKLYREADDDIKKQVVAMLQSSRGTEGILGDILESVGAKNGLDDIISNLIGKK